MPDRSKNNKTVRITIYIRQDIKEKIEELAKKEFKNVSEYLRDLILKEICK